MTKLRKCPCGKVPTRLILEQITDERGYARGDCCGDWAVEYLSGGKDCESAVAYWNASNRLWGDDEHDGD